MTNTGICQICGNTNGAIIEYSWVDAHKTCADNFAAEQEGGAEAQIIAYEMYVIGEE